MHDPYGALRIRGFRQFVTARFFLTASLQIQNVVMGWHVYQLTHDPLSLGLLGLAEAIPAISVALFGGHLADTRNRKHIIVGFTLLLFACSVVLAALSFTQQQLGNAVVLAGIYIVTFVSGLARGLMGPSIFALWPSLVTNKSVFSNAVTWNSSIWQVSSTLGPIIGGLLLAPLQIQGTYVVDALLMAASTSLFAIIAFTPQTSNEIKQPKGTSLFEGARFVFAQPELIGALTLDLFAVLFGGVTALLPMFAQEVLHVGTSGYGLLKAAMGIGAILSASLIAFIPIKRNAGRKMLLSVAIFGICTIAFGFSSWFWLSFVLLVMAGFFDGISVVIRATLTQTRTPDYMKGRVSAINNIFIGSSNEIGAFESGVAARFLGLVPSVVFGGVMCLGVVALIAYAAPKLRALHLE